MATKTPTKTPAARGRMARTKGQSGELEVVRIIRELTGRDVRRRCRQHAGDSDLEGLPGWCVEVKRHATATPGQISGWWSQACQQAHASHAAPVLFYRGDKQGWRVVWCASLHCEHDGLGYLDTLNADPLTWYRMVRHTFNMGAAPYHPSTTPLGQN